MIEEFRWWWWWLRTPDHIDGRRVGRWAAFRTALVMAVR